MVHLQGIGKVSSKCAGDLAVGDVLMWNYGSTSTVERIVKVTAKTITVALSGGYTLKFNASRQVAMA